MTTDPVGGAERPVEASGPSGPRAGFWRRFAAALVDSILIGVVSLVILAADAGLYYAASTIIGIAYYVSLEGGARGQTVGKRLLGIRVLDFGGGGSIGPGRAFIRYVGRIVSGLALFLGYLWMLWDGEKQTWHDKMSTAVVVPVSAYPVS